MHEQEQMRLWAETWRTAGPELDEIRRQEIIATDTCVAVEPWPEQPPRLSSGLVEQQAWFAKLRR